MTRDAEGASPAMAQWFACKAAHPHALLFFQMGDFFELFFEDAEAAAAVLGLALTRRGTHDGQPIPLCGVPLHAAEGYLARLIRRGFRVAIAEQRETAEARSGRAPIRREVVRLVTPGTLTEEALLDSGRANRLLALAASAEPRASKTLGAAWLDLSTGSLETEAVSTADLAALLGRLDPAEILAAPSLPLGDWVSRRAPEMTAPKPADARRTVAAAFGAASLDALGEFADAEAVAAAMALAYAEAASGGRLPVLSPPRRAGGANRLEMDSATRASLEILKPRSEGGPCLLDAIRRTLTAPGARLLSEHLATPLRDPAAITGRQDSWSWLLANPHACDRLRTALKGAPDMARALARLSLGRSGPRDLAAIRDGMVAARAAAQAIDATAPALLAADRAALASVAPEADGALADLLTRALTEPTPVRLDQGAIAAGFDGELDAERRLAADSRGVIAALQLDLAQRHGVAALKIRHHAQLGYVVEVPAAAAETLRAAGMVLRQGMASGARFTSDEVSDLDRRITEATARASRREQAIFAELCGAVLAEAGPIGHAADALSALDVAQSAAALAESGRWCRPVVSDDAAWRIVAGRHPVVEAALPGDARFVPNDCDLSPGRQVLLLTGPNMAGKSTFLRQNALCAVLAQAGQPVPASEARIGAADRLFSRVGAADDLAGGRSTFMVEMTETAAILHQAGPHSLVIVDEIGRGTATLDGLAIAWAVLEALHNVARCRTIFATHFHELAALGGELPRLKPHAMRVREWQGSVVFLHEVAEGAAGRSFGVHVARLAGLPAPVVRRAAQLLRALETRAGRLTDAAALPLFAAADPAQDEAVLDNPGDALRDALAAADPDALSPKQALEMLYRLRALAMSEQKEMLRSM